MCTQHVGDAVWGACVASMASVRAWRAVVRQFSTVHNGRNVAVATCRVLRVLHGSMYDVKSSAPAGTGLITRALTIVGAPSSVRDHAMYTFGVQPWFNLDVMSRENSESTFLPSPSPPLPPAASPAVLAEVAVAADAGAEEGAAGEGVAAGSSR